MRKPSKELLRILSDNVRFYRSTIGISQEKLADKCRLHRTYIGAIERCERNATLSTLEVIAATLGVSVSELLSENLGGNAIE